MTARIHFANASTKRSTAYAEVRISTNLINKSSSSCFSITNLYITSIKKHFITGIQMSMAFFVLFDLFIRNYIIEIDKLNPKIKK